MTRKHFVKHLMAHGISRDQAVGAARKKPADKSYAEYYPLALMAGMLGLVAFSASNVSSSMRALATALAEASM